MRPLRTPLNPSLCISCSELPKSEDWRMKFAGFKVVKSASKNLNKEEHASSENQEFDVYERVILLLLWTLTLSWRRPLSYRNQSIDLQDKSMDWLLYDNGLRHERVENKNFSRWIMLLSNKILLKKFLMICLMSMTKNVAFFFLIITGDNLSDLLCYFN